MAVKMADSATNSESKKKEFVHPDAQHAQHKAKKTSLFAIQPITAFYFFIVANFVSAIFAPIQDCDETYNYWEPTHYVSHGYGRQTWEYSPNYAIRSWLYIAVHAAIANLRRILPQSTKTGEFYFVRYALATFCAVCQTLLFRRVSSILHPRIGVYFMMALIFSPGNFHASSAFLPSSLAMYLVMLGTGVFLDWRGGIKTSQGLAWFAAAAIFGWPFASALCVPFLVEEGLLAITGGPGVILNSASRIGRGVAAAFAMLSLDTAVNSFFYRRFVVIPWNIVKYNVFSSSGGPNLYGTEPWSYYFKNLAINFNLWFILALLALPLFVLHKIFATSKAGGVTSGLRSLVLVTPFYLWLAIFTLQPHKEERFMYPAYPFLALNAAISLHILLMAFGTTDRSTVVGRIPANVRLLITAGVLLSSIALGLSRIYGVYSGYSAPMKIYSTLFDDENLSRNSTVCFGKDWYRFPSSYFLPNGMHAKFITSSFKGLIPGEFAESDFKFRPGIHQVTTGFNDQNKPNPDFYVDLSACDFLVDTQFRMLWPHMLPMETKMREVSVLSLEEPDFQSDWKRWEVLRCEPLLDAARSPSLLSRVLYLPQWMVVGLNATESMTRKWGKHCLLRQRRDR